MAQVLKDEIRNKIQKAALQEFYHHGYHAATMRSIAQEAKIPTGLIYSYYQNKEALLEAVLQPVRYDWEQVVAAEDQKHRNHAIYGLSQAESACLMNLFEHRREFVILMDKSQGTKYEQEKDRFIKVIEAHMLAHRNDECTDPVFIHIVANNFVDGIMQIMYHYKDKDWAIMILQKLSKMYFSGIGY